MIVSSSTLYATFTGYDGLFKYDGATWTRINTTADDMVAGE